MTNLPSVPALSIFFMAVTLLISILLFFGLFLYLRKKMDLKMTPFWIGAAVFISFALILQPIVHNIILNPQADGTHRLSAHLVAYGIFACLSAGIFEETGRFAAFKFLRKKFTGIRTAISYGIGHGGGEALIIAGLAAVGNLSFSIMLNAGMADLLGEAADVAATAAILAESSPLVFLLGGLERIAAVALHMALSLLVWHSVNTKGKLWFYPLSIGLHALFNVIAVLYQFGVITNLFVVEALIFVEAAAIVYVVRRLLKGLRQTDRRPSPEHGHYPTE